MFDIGWAEMLVLGIVVLLVMGPREIPTLLRTIGHYLGRMRAMAAEFRMHMDNMETDIASDRPSGNSPTGKSKPEKRESLDLFAERETPAQKTKNEEQG